MQIETVKGETRKAAGSRAADRLRRDGKLPAIVYGHKETPEPVVLSYRDVQSQMDRHARLVNLELGGKMQSCLIKDVQYDHLGIKMLHMDLARVSLTDRVKVKVPLELKGHAKGVADGGVLLQELAEVEIECSVQSIPENIRINVTDLELDRVFKVKEIPLEEGFKAVTDGETVVLTIHIPIEKAAAMPTPGEGAAETAEPEVIAKGKAPEEGAEEAPKEKKEKK